MANNEKKKIKGFLNKKSFKYGTNAAIITAAVIVMAVVLNLLVGMLDLKLDLTPNKLFSLSDATVNILEGLDKDVEIIGLFDDTEISTGDGYKEVTDLLGLYEKYPSYHCQICGSERNLA